MSQHQLPNLPQPPHVFDKDVSLLREAGQEAGHRVREIHGLIAASSEQPCFSTVIERVLQAENCAQLVSNAATLYTLVDREGPLGLAAAGITSELDKLMRSLKEDPIVARCVEAVWNKQQHEQASDVVLDREKAKGLLECRRDFSQHTSINDNSGKIPTEVKDELKVVSSSFLQNLDKVDDCLWFTREELDGLPEDTIRELEDAPGSSPDKIRLPLSDPRSRWMLAKLNCPEIRRKLYVGTREVAKDNVRLFERAVRLRHKAAQELGYACHTSYRVESMMAKSPETVERLLYGLRDQVVKRLPADVALLTELKKNDPKVASDAPNATQLLWSDVAYYTRLYEESATLVDHDIVSQYFPLLPTVSKMLSLFGRLFGFVFKPLTGDGTTAIEQNLVWHPDVMLYSVFNDVQEGSEFVGYLYLDLHPRPGKSGGAQCRPLHLGCELQLGRQPPQRHFPSTVLLTNFAKGCTLQHADVVLLFHELGHGIHDLSGRCRYSRFHGAETAGDFNEAPSQMLENWCWDASALRLLSGHRETGLPLPDDLISSLTSTKILLPAVKLMPQLKLTLFDHEVHSLKEVTDSLDLSRIYTALDSLGGIQSAGDEHGYVTYRHLFSGSDGTMYSYLWSKALAMDMFDSVFKQNTLDDKEGRRYRHMVLEKGGSQQEMVTITEFLGREPSFSAFYKSLGLS